MAAALINLHREKLDVCRATTKLWIADIFNAALHPSSQNAYVFRNQIIKKVNVCGVVTECSQYGTKTNFRVDDLTGSIRCTLNYSRFIEKDKSNIVLDGKVRALKTRGVDDELAEALSTVLSTAKQRSSLQGEFAVGHFVRVCGFISDFYEERTINAFQVSKPLSEDQEILRICDIVNLYKDIYDKKEDENEQNPTIN